MIHEYAYQMRWHRNTKNYPPSRKTSAGLINARINQENLRARAKELRLKFRYGRTIFHPSETHVNVLFLVAVTLKWTFFIISCLWCTTVSLGPDTDREKMFFYFFGAMQVGVCQFMQNV